MIADFSDKVLQLLASVAETDEVLTNLDLPLYEYQVLDSMRTVQLIMTSRQRRTTTKCPFMPLPRVSPKHRRGRRARVNVATLRTWRSASAAIAHERTRDAS